MRLAAILVERKDAILGRWVGDVLSAYPGEGGAFFLRQEDPFANPVGGAVREGTRDLLEVLLEDGPAERVRGAVRDLVSIRAVQGMPPSRAVGFVPALKGVIRAEIGDDLGDHRLEYEMVDFEARIDRAALDAFDLYCECRERLAELRIGEVKRRVAWSVERAARDAGRGTPPTAAEEALAEAAAPRASADPPAGGGER